jgi:uncharacterized membrane-anchored protein YhcB (DUF1043 family)
MKRIHLFGTLLAVSASFFVGLIIGMIAMRDFMAEEYIVIDPAKLKQYQQIQHQQNKTQGLTA